MYFYDVRFDINEWSSSALSVTLNPKAAEQREEIKAITEDVCKAHGMLFQNPPGM